MSEPNNRDTAREPARRPWEPLDYAKIDAANAEATFTGAGADGGFYS